MTNSNNSLDLLLQKIRECRLCESRLPFAPHPVIRASASARLLIIGQAPGTRVHATGIPFNDPSGDRLREWLQIDRGVFYDENKIAIMPMGLCYPGRDKKGGDLPPCAPCAPLWHPQVRALLPSIKLTLLVGSYAQKFYLKKNVRLTESVLAWRQCPSGYFPLPHPSWRNNAWLKANPWFEREVIPELRRRIKEILA